MVHGQCQMADQWVGSGVKQGGRQKAPIAAELCGREAAVSERTAQRATGSAGSQMRVGLVPRCRRVSMTRRQMGAARSGSSSCRHCGACNDPIKRWSSFAAQDLLSGPRLAGEPPGERAGVAEKLRAIGEVKRSLHLSLWET